MEVNGELSRGQSSFHLTDSFSELFLFCNRNTVKYLKKTQKMCPCKTEGTYVYHQSLTRLLSAGQSKGTMQHVMDPWTAHSHFCQRYLLLLQQTSREHLVCSWEEGKSLLPM